MSNQNYALAKTYESESKYDLALQYYKKALEEVQDHFQAAQIQYNIAYMTAKMGKYADAISQFKAIAADTTNYPILRAYSVQKIGLMYYEYYGGTARQTISAETFKDSPYDSFQKGTSLNVAYTKLFEYAASIYPLATSEARVAYGYSNELLGTLHSATTSPQGREYLSLIAKSLTAADSDVLRMKNIPTEVGLIADILAQEGITIGNLVTLGAADPQQAEALFKRSMQYAATIGIKPGSFTAFHYAAFLAFQFGEARSADIKSLLTPFKVGNDTQIVSGVVDFYKTARTNSTLTVQKSRLVTMGRIDSDFKKYLISLGWKASDF